MTSNMFLTDEMKKAETKRLLEELEAQLGGTGHSWLIAKRPRERVNMANPFESISDYERASMSDVLQAVRSATAAPQRRVVDRLIRAVTNASLLRKALEITVTYSFEGESSWTSI